MAAVLESEIKDGLALIRLRQRRMGHVLLGLIPFVLVAGFSQLDSDLQTYFVLAAVAYGAFLLFYSFRLAFMECPRCQGFYHCRSWLDPTTDKCLHCGLPLDS